MALSVCGPAAPDPQGRELVKHGPPLFPAAGYHDSISEAAVPWHWHEELEALVVEAGTARVSVNGTDHIVKRGEGFFINAGGAGTLLPALRGVPSQVGGGQRGQRDLAEIPGAAALRSMPALRPFRQCPGVGGGGLGGDPGGLAGLRVRRGGL